jgi:4-amino-4-deoxy-L-arabinose transferase-like glycosyltransferase
LGSGEIASRRIGLPVALTAALTIATIVTTVVWSAIDRISQTYDPGRHLLLAASALDDIKAGHPLEPFRAVHIPDYPPLVHYLGALAMEVTGHVGVDAPVIALSIVFVPILAGAAFFAGRTVAGPWAGLAAAAMSLGAPIVISLTHLFLTDLALTAMVGLSLALLMASRHFVLTRYALAAGFAMGLGFLCKQTLPIYLLPFVAVMIARGGWRNPTGVAWAGAPFLALALPWYIVHRHSQGEILGVGPVWTAFVHDASWLSWLPAALRIRSTWPSGFLNDVAWHAWSFGSVQLLAPLVLAVIAGGAFCLMTLLGRARKVPYGPELLVGAGGGLLLVPVFLSRDVRYSMPLLPLLAALAVCWIAALNARWRPIAAAAFVAIGVLNAVLVNTGAGMTQVALGADPANPIEKRLTLVSGNGYVSNRPLSDGDMVGVLHRAAADGIKTVAVDPLATLHPEFSLDGVTLAARMAGLSLPPNNDVEQLHPDDALIVRRDPSQMPLAPCAREPDGTGLYLQRGLTGRSFCP